MLTDERDGVLTVTPDGVAHIRARFEIIVRWPGLPRWSIRGVTDYHTDRVLLPSFSDEERISDVLDGIRKKLNRCVRKDGDRRTRNYPIAGGFDKTHGPDS